MELMKFQMDIITVPKLLYDHGRELGLSIVHFLASKSGIIDASLVNIPFGLSTYNQTRLKQRLTACAFSGSIRPWLPFYFLYVPTHHHNIFLELTGGI